MTLGRRFPRAGHRSLMFGGPGGSHRGRVRHADRQTAKPYTQMTMVTRVAAFVAVCVLAMPCLGQSERREEADKWASRYLEQTGQPATTDAQLRPIALRVLSVADKCSTRPRNVAIVLWGAYTDYAGKYQGWPHYGQVPISPRRFAILLNVVVSEAYDLNGRRPMGRGECIEALVEALQSDDYALAALAFVHDGIDDDYTE